jgi:hypothetical protein
VAVPSVPLSVGRASSVTAATFDCGVATSSTRVVIATLCSTTVNGAEALPCRPVTRLFTREVSPWLPVPSVGVVKLQSRPFSAAAPR